METQNFLIPFTDAVGVVFLDGCSVGFVLFYSRGRSCLFWCCEVDSSFLHFTDTEHLAAMQEETWVLTEIT